MNRNMVHLKSLAACLAAGCAAVAASAGPAWHGVMTLSQPDGTSIQARLAGDEAAHVMTDLGDGRWCRTVTVSGAMPCTVWTVRCTAAVKSPDARPSP